MKIILLFIALCSTAATKPVPPIKIAVLYFSPIDKNLRAELLQSIATTYHCTVTEIEGMATLPAAAYYKARNRYRAPIILNYLNGFAGYDKIIGITTKDISTTNNDVYDWGIMGLGACPGMACVISTFRIKTPDKLLFNERFIKVALHELGHTVGLQHCTFSKTCFMEAADGTIKNLDRETKDLCLNCKKIIDPSIK